jgi:hypothetical protein
MGGIREGWAQPSAARADSCQVRSKISAFGLVAGTPTAVLAAVVMGITYLALGRE